MSETTRTVTNDFPPELALALGASATGEVREFTFKSGGEIYTQTEYFFHRGRVELALEKVTLVKSGVEVERKLGLWQVLRVYGELRNFNGVWSGNDLTALAEYLDFMYRD